MENLKFDFRDVFRAGRYAFSGKKMGIHFLGIALVYVVYKILLYLSLLITGNVESFWSEHHGLLSLPLSGQHPLTYVAVGLGFLFAFIVFFSTSTMVSKITLQQLRGDDFYSMRDSASFIRKQWKSVFGSFLGLIGIFIFCIVWPIGIGLLCKWPLAFIAIAILAILFLAFVYSIVSKRGLIAAISFVLLAIIAIICFVWPLRIGELAIQPTVSRVFTMLSLFIMVPGFFLGLLMAFVAVVFVVSLFFVPAIAASVDQDIFETIYQHFSMVWSQPWRLAVYEVILMLWKTLCTAVLAVLSILGFFLLLLPVNLLIPKEFATIFEHSESWLGEFVGQFVGRFPAVSTETSPSVLLIIGGAITAATILVILGFVLSYLLSMASAGNTIIYVALRKRISDENLLEVEEEEEITTPEPTAEEPEEEIPVEAEGAGEAVAEEEGEPETEGATEDTETQEETDKSEEDKS